MCRVGPSLSACFGLRTADSFTDYAVRAGSADSHVAGRCRAGRSSPPPRPRPPSPGEVPIESRSRPCSAASSARRAKCGPRGLGVLAERRHRHQADDADRAALDERRRARPGATPPLPSSPATLTSTRTSVSGVAVAAELLERRVGGDRVDQPAERQHLLDLAALQVADEVPGRRRRPSARAWPRGPAGGSRRPASPRPRPARPSPPAARTWSRRGSRPARRRARAPARGWPRSCRARCRGSGPGTSGRPARARRGPPGGRCGRASRRWEKKSSGSQLVQSPADSTSLDPGSREQPARDLGQVEHPPGRRSPSPSVARRRSSTSSPTS